MKKTGLIVLFSFLVFTVFSILSVSDITTPIGSKKAIWNITKLASEPRCYKPAPLLSHALPALHKLTFEFKATKSLVPAGDLWIEGEMISNVDSGVKAFKNLSSISSGWVNGTTGDIDWDGDIFQLTKVSAGHLKLEYTKMKIKPGTTGEIKINIIAESRTGKIAYYTEKKTLVIKPCLVLPVSK